MEPRLSECPCPYELSFSLYHHSPRSKYLSIVQPCAKWSRGFLTMRNVLRHKLKIDILEHDIRPLSCRTRVKDTTLVQYRKCVRFSKLFRPTEDYDLVFLFGSGVQKLTVLNSPDLGVAGGNVVVSDSGNFVFLPHYQAVDLLLGTDEEMRDMVRQLEMFAERTKRDLANGLAG